VNLCSFRHKMLSLQAWLGHTLVACKFKSKELKLFAKVGGKYLGTLCLPGFKEVGGDMAEVLMDLQEQAMHLMPHEWCDAQDVVFYVGTTRIVPPGFDYTLSLTEQEAEQARLLLCSTQQIEMMWEHRSSYNACFGAGYANPNPNFDVFAYFHREARRASRRELGPFDYHAKYTNFVEKQTSYACKQGIPIGVSNVVQLLNSEMLGKNGAPAIQAVFANLPDGTPCNFRFGDNLFEYGDPTCTTMALGTFRNGRALLNHAFLPQLATQSIVWYDAQVATTMLLIYASEEAHFWVDWSFFNRVVSTTTKTHIMSYHRGCCFWSSLEPLLFDSHVKV